MQIRKHCADCWNVFQTAADRAADIDQQLGEDQDEQDGARQSDDDDEVTDCDQYDANCSQFCARDR